MRLRSLLFTVAGSLALPMSASAAVSITHAGTYASGIFDDTGNAGGSEVSAYDEENERLFVVNVATNSIDVVDISNPASPTLLMSLDLSSYGSNANSVAVHKGLVAVAVQASPKTDPGKLVLFDTDGVPVA